MTDKQLDPAGEHLEPEDLDAVSGGVFNADIQPSVNLESEAVYQKAGGGGTSMAGKCDVAETIG